VSLFYPEVVAEGGPEVVAEGGPDGVAERKGKDLLEFFSLYRECSGLGKLGVPRFEVFTPEFVYITILDRSKHPSFSFLSSGLGDFKFHLMQGVPSCCPEEKGVGSSYITVGKRYSLNTLDIDNLVRSVVEKGSNPEVLAGFEGDVDYLASIPELNSNVTDHFRFWLTRVCRLYYNGVQDFGMGNKVLSWDRYTAGLEV